MPSDVTLPRGGVYAAARDFARRRPALYAVVRLLKYGPFVGRYDSGMRRRLCAEGCVQGWRMLNLGSGGRYEPGMVNLDVTPVTGPDVVGDGYALPFVPGTLHLVLCEYVIEHVPDPARFLECVRAALRDDGVAYFAVPFLQPLHGEPADFTRWTREGFRLAAERAGFTVALCGVHAGPAFSVFWIVREFLSLVLGLGIRPVTKALRYVFAWLLSPVLVLDAIVPPLFRSETLANGFWFVLAPRRMDESRADA